MDQRKLRVSQEAQTTQTIKHNSLNNNRINNINCRYAKPLRNGSYFTTIHSYPLSLHKSFQFTQIIRCSLVNKVIEPIGIQKIGT